MSDMRDASHAFAVSVAIGEAARAVGITPKRALDLVHALSRAGILEAVLRLARQQHVTRTNRITRTESR